MTDPRVVVNVDLIIKFGGSAITDKNELETLKPSALASAARLIRQCLNNQLTCVVVHGAGSFGHHHAKQYKVNEGWEHLTDTEAVNKVKQGFCLTRKSVLKLHQYVVDALLNEAVPATGLSFYSTWTKNNGHLVDSDLNVLQRIIQSGMVPVLHGDCIYDITKGCGILSGDTIIKTLTKQFWVKRVVFLTNVQGVYNEPPEQNPDARFHRTLYVKDGQIIPQSKGDNYSKASVITDCQDNDVTGGMRLKLQTAVDIITESAGHTEVYICQIGSKFSTQICLHGNSNDDETIGTIIKAQPQS